MRNKKRNGELKGVYVKRKAKQPQSKLDSFESAMVWAKIRQWQESIKEEEETQVNEMILREFYTGYNNG